MYLEKLPYKRFRLKRRVRVQVRLIQNTGFVADIKHLGFYCEGVGKTPKLARLKLARLIVGQFENLLEMTKTDMHPTHRRLLAKCRTFMKIVR